MSIDTIALAGQQGMHSTSRPQFTYRVSFAGDDDYTTGGTPDFVAALQAELTELQGKTVVDVRQAGPCGGYLCSWDRANDAFQVRQCAGAGAPAAEVAAHADLHATTFEVVLDLV